MRSTLALLSLATIALGQANCVPHWATGQSALPGVNGDVNAMATFDDGSGPALFVGGSFAMAGGSSANNVAKWNGSTWSAVAVGLDGPVSAMVVHDDGSGPALYVGGSFSGSGAVSAPKVARWNGTSWSAVGTILVGGPSDTVSALVVHDDGSGPKLFAGGTLGIARWDGAAWSGVGGGVDSAVKALASCNTSLGPRLYAAGSFSMAGGVPAHKIACWDGTTWSNLGTGLTAGGPWTIFGEISLASWDDGNGEDVYVGGDFTSIAGHPAQSLARWDGSAWLPLPAPLPSGAPVVRFLATLPTASGPALHAVVGWQVATLTPSGWSLLPAIGSYPYVVGVFDSGSGPSIHAGGHLVMTRWTGSDWVSVGPGLDGAVEVLASLDVGGGPALYAGGYFLVADGAPVNCVAKRTGSSWTPLGTGVTVPSSPYGGAAVGALAAFDDGSGPCVYAGGNFSFAGGVPALNIARWNGSTWSALGPGLASGPVYAMTAGNLGNGNRLYVGGLFQTAGNLVVNSIAQWDGSSWSALGAGLVDPPWTGIVYDLAIHDDGSGPALYASGLFSLTGGTPVMGLARWNGSTWSAVGANNVATRALASFDDGTGTALYVAGYADSQVRRWNGTTWTSLGTAFQAPPNVGIATFKLTAFDDGTGPALFAAGPIYQGTLGLARWNGTTWSTPGGGLTGPPGNGQAVRSLVVFDDGGGPALFAGGDFLAAGGQISPRVAKWTAGGPPVVRTQPVGQIVTAGSFVTLGVSAVGAPPMSYQWRLDGVAIPGAVWPTTAVPMTTPGAVGTYDVVITNPCGTTTSQPAFVVVQAAVLAMTQPAGPGSVLVTNTSGIPGASYFTAFSFAPANLSNPGNGLWLGLHIPYPDLLSQFLTQSPPFVGVLDASGASAFALPAGSLPPALSGSRVFSVTAIYDPVALSVLGSSAIASLLLL